jgi:hypothetical protein
LAAAKLPHAPLRITLVHRVSHRGGGTGRCRWHKSRYAHQRPIASFGLVRRYLLRVTRSSDSEEPLCVVDGVSACGLPPQSAQSVEWWAPFSSRRALTCRPFLSLRCSEWPCYLNRVGPASNFRITTLRIRGIAFLIRRPPVRLCLPGHLPTDPLARPHGRCTGRLTIGCLWWGLIQNPFASQYA